MSCRFIKYFSLIFILSLHSLAANAGTVKKINTAKKLVTVKLAKEEVVAKGDEVCFFSKSNKKAGCGTVMKTKKSMALVRVKSPKQMKRIRRGMTATPTIVATETEQGEDQTPESTEQTEQTEQTERAPTQESAAYRGEKSPWRVWGLFLPALATPSTAKNLSFKALDPDSTAAADTLWAQDSDMKSAFIGFGFAIGVPVSSFSLNLGLRYHSFTKSLIDADYLDKIEFPFISTEQDATALGFWLDFQYFRLPFGTSLAMDLTTGLDIDMASIELKATKKTDSSEAEFAKATSKLTVLSLRLGGGVEYMFFDSMGMRFGLDVLIPIAEFGKSFSGKIDETETRRPAEAAKDLETALDHKKASVGYGANLGLVLAF